MHFLSLDCITAFGNKEDHCTYNDLKILPGSKFTLTSPDCMQCSCSKAGLECCGYGFAAGKITPPEGCIVINDACKPVFVRKDKSTEKCTPAKSQTDKKVSAKKIG